MIIALVCIAGVLALAVVASPMRPDPSLEAEVRYRLEHPAALKRQRAVLVNTTRRSPFPYQRNEEAMIEAPALSSPNIPSTPTVRGCNVCSRPTVIRVDVRLQSSRWLVCGPCAITMAVKAYDVERCAILSFSFPQPNPWTTGDGRYFAECGDARAQQREYEAKCGRYTERVRKLAATRILRGIGRAAPRLVNVEQERAS